MITSGARHFLLLLTITIFLSACNQENEKNKEEQIAGVLSAPVNITIIDCKNCGGKEAGEQIQSNVLKQAKIHIVEQSSKEGVRLIQKFNPITLPIFVFDEGARNGEIKTFLSEITEEKDNEFLLLPEKVGLRTGKELLTSPAVNSFDHRTVGTTNAPIQIVEFSDFECPYCGNFYKETYKKIKDKYNDKVSFIYKNLPLEMHQFAQKAAEAVQCAAVQGKFSEMHNILFENNSALEIENIKKYAKEIGLNENFNNCLDTGEKTNEIVKQKQDAFALGITGTPAFIINEKTVIGGAYPFPYFENIIDEMLK